MAIFHPASRMADVTSFLVMDVLERAQAMERGGADIIHMEIGEPDFDTPSCIVDEAKQALDDGFTHYTHSMGDLDLREAVAEYHRKRYGTHVDPGHIFIFPGTSPGMTMLFLALLDPGDEVILSNPGYACYASFVRMAGGVPVEVPTYEEDGFQFRPEDVAKRIGPRTKAILVNSPCNPTGILLDPDRMKALADLGPLVVSDEIYHGLTYGGEAEHSMLEFTDNTVIVNGFSKAFAMTGWRLGYLVVPEQLVRPMQLIMQNCFISPNAAAQRAGIAALRLAGDEVVRMRDLYDERRRFVLKELRDMGFSIPVEPKGAFYTLINARHLSGDSLSLAFDILEKARVGVAPGIDFGSQAEGFLRLSYANSLKNLAEAMRRLRVYVEERKK